LTFALGDARGAVDRALATARQQHWARRLWQRDHTLWRPDPTEISNRLGWLDCPTAMESHLPEIGAFVAEVRAAGYTRAVLLGMGGSSLAPEVFRTTFGVAAGHLDLAVLDSTDPRAVRDRLADTDPATTLFVVSTKSGGTVETLSLFLTCYRAAVAALGATAAGARFAAITDPGSKLEQMARELGFRRVFRNDPAIGGRYSALSHFGLVPAALVGVDVRRLLEQARVAAALCRQEADNPGVALGVALGTLARAGRDKLTLVLPESLCGFGDWAEQLVAESLGKLGTGVLPVVGEQPAAPAVYGADRVFAVFGEAGDPAALAAAGHPVLRLPLAGPYDLGDQFFRWEFAVAVAGAVLGVNPFDQPDVEAAKVRAREMVAAYRESGDLPSPQPTLEADGVGIWAEFPVGSAADALARFLGQARPGDYLAVQAYLPPDRATDAALGELRRAARRRSRLAVTVGYGPRFLHSTGQLHKGDGGNGLFLQLTADPQARVPIPDGVHTDASSLGFETLIAAQALGDRQALLDAGRRVLRLHLGKQPVARIAELAAALGG
jgi:glucose-6-phosphate isomerase